MSPDVLSRLGAWLASALAASAGDQRWAMAATLALVGVDQAAPGLGVGRAIGDLLTQIDFSAAVLRFMLAFLLHRYGEQARYIIEKRLGLWVSLGAAVVVIGIVIAVYLI